MLREKIKAICMRPCANIPQAKMGFLPIKSPSLVTEILPKTTPDKKKTPINPIVDRFEQNSSSCTIMLSKVY